MMQESEQDVKTNVIYDKGTEDIDCLHALS